MVRLSGEYRDSSLTSAYGGGATSSADVRSALAAFEKARLHWPLLPQLREAAAPAAERGGEGGAAAAGGAGPMDADSDSDDA